MMRLLCCFVRTMSEEHLENEATPRGVIRPARFIEFLAGVSEGPEKNSHYISFFGFK